LHQKRAEIESDVNLDSFGSGSGLLDLSWHNDDTSLGGLLDEIYTGENASLEPVPENSDYPPIYVPKKSKSLFSFLRDNKKPGKPKPKRPLFGKNPQKPINKKPKR